MHGRRSIWGVALLVTGACGGDTVVDGGLGDAGTIPIDAAFDGAPDDALFDVGDALDGALTDGTIATDGSSVDATSARDASDGAACEAERCNAFDDDCDGRVDEESCDGCRAELGPSDHVYLFCARPLIGFDAWAGGCEDLGPGYRLVDLSDESEEVFVGARVTTPVWVGLRAFGVDPTLRDVGGAARDRASFTIDPADTTMSDDTCFSYGPSGLRDELCSGVLGARRSIACEAPIARQAPRGVAETCNGLDDDLDGPIDEGAICEGCVAFRFADHLYYRCDEPRTWDDARATCERIGAVLTSVDSADENRMFSLLARSFEGPTWLGASDDPARVAGATVNHFRWIDGCSVDDGFSYFEAAEPTYDDTENCLAMSTTGPADRWIDVGCAELDAYACESTPTLGP